MLSSLFLGIMEDMTHLSKDILATIAYYDTFQYPLTGFEIWKYLLTLKSEEETSQDVVVSLGDVTRTLQSDSLEKWIEERSGFYFLKGRRKLVKKRLKRGKIAIRKLKGVRRLVKWLRFVPYVRMVALTGSLAMHNSDAEGDWDLLVVLRPGHIWTGRTLVTGLLQLMGQRRHGDHTKDRACLNYWITSDSLEIITKDLFSSSEYFFLSPLFGRDEFKRFQMKNRWITRFRAHYGMTELPSLLLVPDAFFARATRNIGEILFSDQAIERWLASWQKEKIEKNPKTHLPGSLIEATDKALIFLPEPQGPHVFETFKRKMSELEAR